MDYHENGKAGDFIIYGIFSLEATITALGMAALFIGVCAINRVELVDRRVVSVEAVPSEKVNILWTDLYQDGEWVMEKLGNLFSPVAELL